MRPPIATSDDGAREYLGCTLAKRPVLRYHGGKWMLAPWILSHFPAHKVYVEPYGGAASVLIRKKRSYAEVYNDLDGELVNLFTVMRDDGKELCRLLSLTPFARAEFLLSYEPSGYSLEQARRTVVRSFMGFGSNAHNKATGFRSCSNRSGTTPAHDWRNYPEAAIALVERLRGVVIENRDALLCMVQHDSPQTLHYVDPPYVLSTRSDSMPDYRHEMSDAQHVALAETLHELQGFVVLSAYPSGLYRHLYEDWTLITRDSRADGAKKRVEALYLNPHATAATQRTLMEFP